MPQYVNGMIIMYFLKKLFSYLGTFIKRPYGVVPHFHD